MANTWEVAIVGAGFSGLAMAIQLKKAGRHDFVVLEEAAEVGGTWRENTYPGCPCDILSHLYSFSFEPNPHWTRQYPTQPEIWDYLRRCVVKYRIGPHIRFRTRVTAVEFDDDSTTWRLATNTGEAVRARAVVGAFGPLHEPAIPDLPGLHRFAGTMFHSARWDHDHDLTGRRVAVIGTGASAIQFIPQIAKRVDRLQIFQRTPPWIMPKPDHEIRRFEHRLFRWFPPAQRAFRHLIYWRQEAAALRFVVNPRLMRLAEALATRNIERHVHDPALRAALTPRYVIGCKRILISNDYYPTPNRPNVGLTTRCLRELDRGRTIDVRPAAEHAFNDWVQSKLRGTVWQTGCRSWYLNDEGRNRTLWPGFTFTYWWRTRTPRLSDYEVVAR